MGVYDNIDGVLDTLLTLARGEAACAGTVPAAAPHPNPLPVKCSDGERERWSNANAIGVSRYPCAPGQVVCPQEGQGCKMGRWR